MLQRVSAIKPARLANTISRCATYEVRAYSTSGDDSAKVSAVYKRLGVDLSDASLMTQSITHKSFAHGSVPTNEKLGYLGRTFLQMQVTEQKWDTVKSNRTLRSSVAHATATDKLAKVARSMGIDEVMRWKSASSSADSKVGEDTVLAHTMEAIVGAVYHDKGSKAARELVSKHIYTY
ncbi:MAG: ribonuclease-III-like-domain-containing protein [Linnemannia gamsii]|nr:MAG: ribonuclease-III-like-domain-containing protein [Linnemannia gamsii]